MPPDQSPLPPSLSGGTITVTRRMVTLVPCPGCRRDLDITSVSVGAMICCPECKNVTWAPEYVPRWWHKTRNHLLSMLGAFIVGVLSSMVASYVMNASKAAPTTQQSPGTQRP